MEKHNRIFKGVFIPAFILDSKKLTANEKLLWAEISALSDKRTNRSCTASNLYLSKIIGCSVPTVTRSIKKFLDLDILLVTSGANYRRKMFAVLPNQNDEVGFLPNQNDEEPNQNDLLPNQNDEEPNQNDYIVNSLDNSLDNNKSCSKEETTTDEVEIEYKSKKSASQKRRKKVAAKKESPKGLLFAATEMGQDFKVFESCFDETLRHEVDLCFYWTRALKWSNEKEVKLKDWLSQIKSWMQSDKQRGQLKLKSETPKNQNNGTRKGSIVDIEQAERVTRSILSRKNRV